MVETVNVVIKHICKGNCGSMNPEDKMEKKLHYQHISQWARKRMQKCLSGISQKAIRKQKPNEFYSYRLVKNKK